MSKVPMMAALLSGALAGACADARSARPAGSGGDAPADTPAKKPVAPVPPEPAPAPAPRVATVPEAALLQSRIEGFFEDHVGRRLYVQVDRPLYRPGESVWLRVWDLRARDLAAMPEPVRVELVGPRGNTIAEQSLNPGASAGGVFDLDASLPGGEYVLRAHAGGATAERPIVLNAFEAPRLKKTLEFLRKAYGENDEVSATIEVKRPTGEPIAKRALRLAVTVDGAPLEASPVTTDEKGGAIVKFRLPARIAGGDGLLTVLVDDGGITESISKRIPILMNRLQLAFFPEGGGLVEGLESRVYFDAKTPLGKPADVSGEVTDDLGHVVARFTSHRDGLGRFTFTPATGRRYAARVTQPAGIAEAFQLPLPAVSGCVLRAFDDLDGEAPELRVLVRCSEPKTVVVSAMLREKPIDGAVVEVSPGKPAVVYLRAKDDALARAQGVARVTVFDAELNPLAERLVYRNRRHRLQVKVAPERREYAPREEVTLAIHASDGSGRPVQADFALAVVDDTVVSYADDKTGHLLSRLHLEPELPGTVEEPNHYFDLTEEKSALSMDLLMGTRGWRRFEWAQVKTIDPDPRARAKKRAEEARRREEAERRRQIHFNAMEMDGMALADDEGGGGWWPFNKGKALVPRAAPAAIPAPPPAVKAEKAQVAAKPAELPKPVLADLAGPARRERGPAFRDRGPGDRADLAAREPPPSPVRVFPVPKHSPADTGPRSDFRDTIYWNPSVRTGRDGAAKVSFPTSDAITSFRVVTEGAGAGLAGRDETVFKSSLPFSMSVKLPLEVSAGDEVLVPLTLSNERPRELALDLAAAFGTLLTATGKVEQAPVLAGHARSSLFFPLKVTGRSGESEVRVKAAAAGLADEFVRSVRVTPIGFPQQFTASGQLAKGRKIELDLGKSLPGTVVPRVTLYPSPVATMVAGLEGMLRQPSGCFEQTSSTNYPNVMVMQYLRENGVADAGLLEKSGRLLDDGYRRLTGYETKTKGYEWFGGAPGHEALTAYGLVQFTDMKRVYGNVDDAMVVRTANWLKARRDGSGGYQRDPKALDSFGRAAPEVTNAYITWGLAKVGEHRGLEKELDVTSKLARDTKDAYLLSLAAGTLLAVPDRRAEGRAAAARLAKLQDRNGAWTKADHSITRSGGTNLHIETTSLAVLALLEAGGHDGEVRRAVAWLNDNRGAFGQWGATQATVLALKAMTAYAKDSRRTRSPGTVTVLVNGKKAATAAYAAGHRDPLVLEGFADAFAPGANTLELVHDGEEIPFTLSVEYRSTLPATSAQAKVDVATKLAKTSVKMGETVRLEATVRNRTAAGLPMTMARVGFPGGLTTQAWQLKELREKGVVAFYETGPREVVLYFRDMQPSQTKQIPLELVAAVPGRYTAPASSAYLYYDDEHKTWAPAVEVEVKP